MLPHTLHGRTIAALLLPVDDPMEQSLLRGTLRWDGTALWFEWYSGGFPLPFDLKQLARAILPVTEAFRSSLLRDSGNPLGADVAAALQGAEYFCACWVRSAPLEAVTARGMMGVGGRPRAEQIVDVARWSKP